MRALRLLVAAFTFISLLSGVANAERRVALVIGNGAYQNVPQLPNPPRDAALIDTALKQAGFEVTLASDLDHDGLVKALRNFGKAADGADWAVLYYAGHGIEMGGVNYLIPIDARLETDRDVGFEAVPLDQVQSAMDGARSLRVIILDACRNNPFVAAMKKSSGGGRDIGRGLARSEPVQGSLIAYSAREGTIAADGNGANSPFASALATHLVEPGVEVDKLFRLVRDDVLEATGQKQEPVVYAALPGRESFYFVSPGESGGGTVQIAPRIEPAAPGSSAEVDYQAAERVGTVAAWDAFLRKHGGDADDFYVALAKEARLKLASLPSPRQPEPEPQPAEPQSGEKWAAISNDYRGNVYFGWNANRDKAIATSVAECVRVYPKYCTSRAPGQYTGVTNDMTQVFTLTCCTSPSPGNCTTGNGPSVDSSNKANLDVLAKAGYSGCALRSAYSASSGKRLK